MAGEPVSRILCRMHPRNETHTEAIIPLGHNSRCGSSSLPEGYSLQRLRAAKGAHAFSHREAEVGNRERRAGPALPSYLALHHAGFSSLPTLPQERWALTPPFHPYLTKRPAIRRRPEGFPPRYHRAARSHRRSIFCGTFRDRARTSSAWPRKCPLALPGALPI